LAIQVAEVFTEIARFTDVTTFCIYGGVEQQSQIEKLEHGVDVLVATPGRMFDMISQGYLRLHRINTLILDEADHMLDLGFIEDITDIKSKLPQRHQTLFFSATINKDIKRLAYSLVSNAIRIQISPEDPVSQNVSHSVVFVEMDDKRFFLERFLKDNPDSKVLVFVRTKVRAERVLKAMERVGLSSTALHGDKEQQERATLLGDFKTGKTKVLIATDISARGIDVPNVDFVINYDLPDKSENYVHRVGRTGRGTQKGQAISFCSEDEKIILDNIEGFLGNNIEIMAVSNLDYEQTKDLSSNGSDDWQSLLDLDDSFEKKKKKK
jgi:ATP-dependent RNA helicase RhlE